jgi:hypothetical protein
VTPGIVIILKILGQDSVQVSLAEHDDVIQTLPAYGTDDSFAIRILPRRPRCNQDLFDAHVLDSLFEVVTVDAVAIADEKPRCLFVRESLGDLLGGPFGVGIRGNVEVDDLPPVMPEYNEDVQNPKGHGRHGEEVTGRLPRLVAVVRQGNLRLE